MAEMVESIHLQTHKVHNSETFNNNKYWNYLQSTPKI